MIDHELFTDEIARLALVRGHDTLSKPALAEYYEILSTEMTDEEFRDACHQLKREDNPHFPPPGAFLAFVREARSEDVEHAANEAFAMVMESRSWTGNGRTNWIKPELLDHLGDPARYAVKVIGQNRLEHVGDGKSRDFARRDFVEAYKRHLDREARSVGPVRIGSGEPVRIGNAVDRLEESFLPERTP